MSDDLRAFFEGLPKAELHVHHIGSASPDAVLQLAQRHGGISPVPTDREALALFHLHRLRAFHRGLPVRG